MARGPLAGRFRGDRFRPRAPARGRGSRQLGPARGSTGCRHPLAYEDYFPCTDCHADMEVNPERRELEEMHDDIELDHGPERPLVLRLPQPRRSRQLAARQRHADRLRRVLPPVRPVPRHHLPRLARGHPRPARGLLERRQELPALRPLPQPARARVPGRSNRCRRRCGRSS